MLDYQAGYRAAVGEGARVKLIDRVTGVIAGGPQPWRDLGYARRRQVLRLARRGLLYPDPEVWAITTAWARWQLTLPPSRRLLRATAVTVSVSAAIGIAVMPLVFVLPGEVVVVQNYGWGHPHRLAARRARLPLRRHTLAGRARHRPAALVKQPAPSSQRLIDVQTSVMPSRSSSWALVTASSS
jgi:hypothetical protein